MAQNKFNYIESAAFTDTGAVRKHNEDSFAVLSDDGCFFVSDGMGGGEAGELASQIIEEYITDQLCHSANDLPGSRKYAVQQAIHRANRQIREYAAQHHFRQMGATLALLLWDSWDPRQALLCHLGDSRIYLLRQGVLVRLTEDHTIGAELAVETADRLLGNHQKSAISHILTRAIGISANAFPEWRSIEVAPCDTFLICSDGVSTMLDDNEIQEIMNSSEKLAEISCRLAEKVSSAGANDNYTFVICRAAEILPPPEEHSAEDVCENNYLLKTAIHHSML